MQEIIHPDHEAAVLLRLITIAVEAALLTVVEVQATVAEAVVVVAPVRQVRIQEVEVHRVVHHPAVLVAPVAVVAAVEDNRINFEY